MYTIDCTSALIENPNTYPCNDIADTAHTDGTTNTFAALSESE